MSEALNVQKKRFCRFFIETHQRFRVEDLAWPELDAESRQRLAALPIWQEAVQTEAMTALVVSTMGAAEQDPLLREAISLQGLEEARHAALLKQLTRRYGIPAVVTATEPPADPEWAFMRIGYGECFDSFFAFGLFALVRDSGFFPAGLVALFEPVMQEEARHIIFHANWVVYRQARLGYVRRPAYVFRRGLAVWLQMVSRVKTALRVKAEGGDEENFTMTAHRSLGDMSAERFIEICLSESERRLSAYDPRLLRPTFVPKAARALLATLTRVHRSR